MVAPRDSAPVGNRAAPASPAGESAYRRQGPHPCLFQQPEKTLHIWHGYPWAMLHLVKCWGRRCHHRDERHPSLVLLICFAPLTTLPDIARQFCRHTPVEKRSPCGEGISFQKQFGGLGGMAQWKSVCLAHTRPSARPLA